MYILHARKRHPLHTGPIASHRLKSPHVWLLYIYSVLYIYTCSVHNARYIKSLQLKFLSQGRIRDARPHDIIIFAFFDTHSTGYILANTHSIGRIGPSYWMGQDIKVSLLID